MYDSGECVNGHCGGWNCSSTSGGKETCQCFIDEKMQLYDVGMASMHAMDCDALVGLSAMSLENPILLFDCARPSRTLEESRSILQHSALFCRHDMPLTIMTILVTGLSRDGHWTDR